MALYSFHDDNNEPVYGYGSVPQVLVGKELGRRDDGGGEGGEEGPARGSVLWRVRLLPVLVLKFWNQSRTGRGTGVPSSPPRGVAVERPGQPTAQRGRRLSHGGALAKVLRTLESGLSWPQGWRFLSSSLAAGACVCSVSRARRSPVIRHRPTPGRSRGRSRVL